MSGSFADTLKGWEGSPVTVVNPQSFRRGAITDAIDLETFEAKLVSVGGDYIEVAYEAKKKGEVQGVTQYIPFSQIRRVSVWGSENLIHV